MILKHWPKHWSALLAFSLCAAPGASYASERHCDPKDPQSCVQAVTEGEQVPFPGVLMTHRRAAKLVTTTEQCADEKALSLEEASELHLIQLKLAEDLRINDQQAHKLQLGLMQKRMIQMEKELSPPWYERPVFVAAVSVLATVAVFAGAVKTVEVLR